MKLFFLLAVLAVALAEYKAFIDPQVINQLKSGKASINVLMEEKANLEQFEKISCETQKGYKILHELQSTALLSQASLVQYLKEKKIPFTSYFITNMINIEDASMDLINLISERREVKKISSDHGWEVQLGTKDLVDDSKTQNQVEWNIQHVNATQVWAQGFDGTGYTVATADTGIEYEHEALIKQYRGNSEGKIVNDYNWWDGVKEAHFTTTNKCGYNSSKPCDDNGHGTHCCGTSCGGTATRKIGIAKGSKWIGCRVMEGGFARDKTIISCLQFFLAPTDLQGRNPKPELRPISIGNSYGCNPTRCPDSEVQKDAVEALYAAGVFMSVSAGNSGPRCSTVDRAPTHYEKSFVVGATEFQSTRLASFSSRGPVTVDGSNRRKPDITAPGVRVTSSVPGNRYQAFSGTSMASPLINGAIAVICSANPKIARNMKCVQDIIQRTALHQESTECSSQTKSPNNLFGYGTINVLAAVQYAREHGCE